jgi:DNA polymerase III subunit delta'
MASVNAHVLTTVPGQGAAMTFLTSAAGRPHHAYVFAGPEGSGKSLAARAFVAALLCHEGGCGECRDCRLALKDQHPNEFLIEPEGRDIHVETIREEVWQPASRTAPEPGRKVFVIREADRLSPAAADTLLKVLEEPPADCVFLLMSARAHELPDTVLSRCHLVTFTALSESFVVESLVAEGVDPVKAALAARLAGGNMGRARRLAVAEDGLRFREAARDAIELAAQGPPGGLAAADVVLDVAKGYKDLLDEDRERDLAPFRDEKGQDEPAYRGAIRKITDRYKRKERRAERDYVDWVLLAVSALLRDRIAVSVGVPATELMNPDLAPGDVLGVTRAAYGLAAMEAARAELAEDFNLNVRLVLERAFLELADVAA